MHERAAAPGGRFALDQGTDRSLQFGLARIYNIDAGRIGLGRIGADVRPPVRERHAPARDVDAAVEDVPGVVDCVVLDADPDGGRRWRMHMSAALADVAHRELRNACVLGEAIERGPWGDAGCGRRRFRRRGRSRPSQSASGDDEDRNDGERNAVPARSHSRILVWERCRA